MPSLLSWSLDDVKYDGCCCHVAISEMVRGEEDGLTADQIAVKEAEMEVRRKEQIIATGQRYYASQNWGIRRLVRKEASHHQEEPRQGQKVEEMVLQTL